MTGAVVRTWQFERGELPAGVHEGSVVHRVAEALFEVEPDLVRFSYSDRVTDDMCAGEIVTPGYAIPDARMQRLLQRQPAAAMMNFSSRIAPEESL